MKNIVLSAFLSCLIFTTFSQKWSSFGGNLSFQANKLVNANLKKDEVITTNFAFNPGVDLVYSVNTSEYFQLSMELGFSKVKNSLTYLDLDTTFNFKGERTITFNALDVGLMMKAFSDAGFYAEMGAKYNFVISAIDKERESLTWIDASKNVSNYMSFVFGAGILAYKKYRTNISFGFRGELGFTNLLSSYGKEIYYPTYKKYENEDIYRYISGMIVVNLCYDIGVLNSSRQTHRHSYFKISK